MYFQNIPNSTPAGILHPWTTRRAKSLGGRTSSPEPICFITGQDGDHIQKDVRTYQDSLPKCLTNQHNNGF